MWGSWMGVTIGGVLVVLLIIGIAFGTSALLFPVIIAAALMAAAAVAYVVRAGARGASEGPGSAPDPVRDAAPASGEGASTPYEDPRKI
jgi:multisubunit Na+/H+ antiporter MnhC subunit